MQKNIGSILVVCTQNKLDMNTEISLALSACSVNIESDVAQTHGRQTTITYQRVFS